ncbi:hypothetical protein KOR34_30700 [Posidoniimonas corsicana]|uniref:Uncharacterized protein n=1 Tax=Posidoniimonas corsicana TaxID=1938618 RepID=A0A5C5VK68_9BACT|nr:hypothetical protein KOR34_30700 [Posidoniimonas corsicana]
MDPGDRFGGLDLDNHGVFNDQIEPISLVKPDPAKLDGNGNLPPHFESALLEFMGKNYLVHRLKQPRPDLTMYY